MNEKQYLDSLEEHLMQLNPKERSDIRRDFEEYFEHGRHEGKSTEEIIEALGDPATISIDLLEAYSEEDFVEEVVLSKVSVNELYHHIDAKVEDVNFIIYPTDREQAYIEIKDKDDRTEANLDIVNDTLYVKVKRKSIVKRFLFITFIGDLGSSDVTLFVPRIHYHSMKVNNDNGRIKVSEIHADTVKLYSDNGRVVVEQMKGKTLSAESDNGRVIVSNSQFDVIEAESDNGRIVSEHNIGNEIHLKTSNGSIELVETIGAITAKSSNGKIDAKLSEVTAKSKLVTQNGNVIVRTPKPLENILIVASTNWGNISIYGENTKTYEQGTANVPLMLSSSNGKVLVEVNESLVKL